MPHNMRHSFFFLQIYFRENPSLHTSQVLLKREKKLYIMELQKLTNGHHHDFQHLEEGYVSLISSDFAFKTELYACL